jgi:hypothetical protein
MLDAVPLRERFRRFAVLFGALLLVAEVLLVAATGGGCSQETVIVVALDGGSSSTASATIGPDGGVVRLGQASITIPPGALSRATTITISVSADSPPPPYVASSKLYSSILGGSHSRSPPP